ncbi:MAG: ATP-binding protein [Spirochaetales bacterium]|nr:ATP-binding protein [Spirochaetales bacterium]
MGPNASGKTTLGKAIDAVFDMVTHKTVNKLIDGIKDKDKNAYATIYFVSKRGILSELEVTISSENYLFDISYKEEVIRINDSFESCRKRLDKKEGTLTSLDKVQTLTGPINVMFSQPGLKRTFELSGEEKEEYLTCLRAVITALDPSFENVELSQEMEDSYILRRKKRSISITNGEIVNRDLLSSGTIKGIEIALFTALISSSSGFFYVDELFSYIETNIERLMFSIMANKLRPDSQLIFTTHNTDMLTLQLPKHSYIFLQRTEEENSSSIIPVYAEKYLRRATDSVRNAAMNNLFGTIPDETKLYGLTEE